VLHSVMGYTGPCQGLVRAIRNTSEGSHDLTHAPEALHPIARIVEDFDLRTYWLGFCCDSGCDSCCDSCCEYSRDDLVRVEIEEPTEVRDERYDDPDGSKAKGLSLDA